MERHVLFGAKPGGVGYRDGKRRARIAGLPDGRELSRNGELPVGVAVEQDRGKRKRKPVGISMTPGVARPTSTVAKRRADKEEPGKARPGHR